MSVNAVNPSNIWFVEVNGEPRAFTSREAAVAYLRELYGAQEARWQVKVRRPRRCRHLSV
jgi:hypothetical protein